MALLLLTVIDLERLKSRSPRIQSLVMHKGANFRPRVSIRHYHTRYTCMPPPEKNITAVAVQFAA